MPGTLRYWDGAAWTEHRVASPQSAEPHRRVPGELWFALGATAVMIIGAVGPWVDAVIVSVGGLNGDGIIVLVAGLVAAGPLLYSWTQRPDLLRSVAVWAIVCGLVGSATAIYDIVQIYGADTELFGARIGNPGWGIWASVAGSLTLIVAAASLLAMERRVRGTQ